jgi:hypothetical protein
LVQLVDGDRGGVTSGDDLKTSRLDVCQVPGWSFKVEVVSLNTHVAEDMIDLSLRTIALEGSDDVPVSFICPTCGHDPGRKVMMRIARPAD